MLLDLAGARQPQTPLRPLTTLPVGAGERMEADWEATWRRGWFGLTEYAPRNAFEEATDAFRRHGLAAPRNPFDLPPDSRTDPLTDLSQRALRAATDGPTRVRLTEAWRAAAAAAREKFPDLADEFPDPFEIDQQVRRQALLAQQRAAEAEAGGQGFGTWAAGMLGSMGAAILTDPLQLVTLPVGAPTRLTGGVALRILKAAAIEGSVAAGTQAGSTTLNRAAQEAAGITPDPLADIAIAGAGGALLGGGLRGAIEGWRAARRLGASNPEADAALSAAQAWEMAQAGNPGGGAPGAHADALEKVLADTAAGRPTTASVPPPSRRQLADWIETVDDPAQAEPAARGFIERVLAAPAGRVRGFASRFLDEAEASALRAQGLPVGTETARALTSDGVRHAWLRHGPDAARPDGAPPISVEDLAGWQRFIAAAIDAQPTVADRGHPAMTYLARDAQGGLVVVEEFRARTGLLALNDLYRLAPGHGAQRLDQVAGMRERMWKAGGPVPNASPAAARPPERTSATPGLGATIPQALGRFQTFTPAGRSVLVEPRVMELNTLVASHLDDFRPNPAYPHAEGIQPRDRTRESDQQWVRETASALNPELLGRSSTADTGAPIIGPDNVVESGNGRVMAMRRAASEHPEAWAAYQQWLADQGFDLSAFRNPVLVMDRIGALTAAERAAFVTEANAPTAARMSAAEQARADAARLDAILDLHKGGDVALERNADFVRAFLGALPRSEANALRTADGALSAEGARRLRAAVLARAYGDQAGALLERMLENTDFDIKAVAGALEDAAADWAAMRVLAARDLLPGDPDRTADLLAAVRALEHARGSGQRVDDWLANGDFLDPTRGLSDRAMAFLGGFFREDAPVFSRAASRETVAGRLKGYAQAAIATRQTEMFEPAAARVAETAPEPDTTPQNVLAARTALEAAEGSQPPKADEALFLDAQRAAMAQDFSVPQPGADGAVTAKGARALLDEAEQAGVDAASAAACLVGGGAA